jgi:inorganic pyrophosphatase
MRREIGNIEVLVEIPRGSRNKYEYDHATGFIRLDRVLFSSVHYPTDYGFVIGTRGDDGDPLDALVLVEEPTFPGCRVLARPIGFLCMKDQDQLDQKILAVPVADPRFKGVNYLADLQEHWLREIENFFNTYKMLEGKDTSIEGWSGSEEAKSLLESCRAIDTEKRQRRKRERVR